MFENTEKYQKAFERLEEDDPNFLMTIREEAKEEGNDRHEVAWGMDDVDWEKIRIFSKFLKIFYDATLQFSSANYVTGNSFFLKLMSIHDTIELENEKDSYLLRKMVDYMKKKFEKYWGNFDNMNHLLYVGLVLNLRYKLRYLEYCFGTLYERQKAIDMAGRVKVVLEDLYKYYTQNQVGSSSASAAAQAQCQNPSGSMEGDDSSVVDAKAMRMMRFKKHLKVIESSNTKSEVDKYLLESCEDVLMIILIFWLGGRLIPHDTMCFQELHDMFLQFWYPLWPQNLPLVWLVVSLIPFGVYCLHLWWKPSFVVKIGSVLHRLQSTFVLPWMMLKSLKSLMQV